MPKISLKLSRLSISEKLDLAKRIASSLAGNASFPSPNPTLAQLGTAMNNLRTAHEEALLARQQAKEKTAIQNQREDEFDDVVTRMAAFIASIAGEDPVLIASAGLDSTAASTSGPPVMPAAFAVTFGDADGELDASWNASERAASYILEQSLQSPPNAQWTQVAVTTKSTHTITGLQSGVRYWFRVAAVGPDGQSGFSDPATRIAP